MKRMNEPGYQVGFRVNTEAYNMFEKWFLNNSVSGDKQNGSLSTTGSGVQEGVNDSGVHMLPTLSDMSTRVASPLPRLIMFSNIGTESNMRKRTVWKISGRGSSVSG